MTDLILPSSVLREQLDRYIVPTPGEHRELRRALIDVDPSLRLELLAPGAPVFGGAKPGYWHLVVYGRNGAPDDWQPVEAPNGDPIDPHMGLIRQLQNGDLWHPGVLRDREKAKQQRTAAWERHKARMREDRQAEMTERVLSKVNPRISVPRSIS